jgi:hypothetical protein
MDHVLQPDMLMVPSIWSAITPPIAANRVLVDHHPTAAAFECHHLPSGEQTVQSIRKNILIGPILENDRNQH